MIGKSQIFDSGKKIINNNLKINSNNNLYSKIAPPNTFKRRNTNLMLNKPKLFMRYENTSQTSQINDSNYKSNFLKKNPFLINSHTSGSNNDSDFKLTKNANSTFIDKIKIIKGDLFNEQKIIITPKKTVLDKIKINNKINGENLKSKDRTDNPKKNNNINIEKENNNIIKNFFEMNFDKKEENKIIKEKYNNLNDNKSFNNEYIKNKYDFLLEKTRDLLNNYQKIVDYYQEKEKK